LVKTAFPLGVVIIPVKGRKIPLCTVLGRLQGNGMISLLGRERRQEQESAKQKNDQRGPNTQRAWLFLLGTGESHSG
jgi:hypothetical protein